MGSDETGSTGDESGIIREIADRRILLGL